MTQWRDRYDDAAAEEAARFSRSTDEELLDAVRRGATGEYCTVWGVLAARTARPELCWQLYDVLRSDRPYLDRYHCATALLRLLGCRDFQPVELSAAWPVVLGNLDKLRAIVTSRVGPPVR